ncbi:hypothetical protein D3C76_692100 [compost metagenome]
MHRHAQGMAIGQRRLPVGLLHRQVQYAQMPRMRLEQRASIFHRVLAGRCGQLVNQRFHDEGGMGMSHRTQPQHADAGLGRMQLHLMIGQPLQIGTVRHALHGRLVDAVLDHGGFERGAGHDRLSDQHMLPRHRQAIGTEADPRLVQERRAVIAATDVILSRPHGFHRPAHGLGDLHRFGDKVRSRVGSPAETAAEELGVDLHLLGFEPGDLAGDHLVQGLELRTGPDLAFVLGDAHRAVERLHRRMGQVGHAVLGIDCLGRLGQCGLGIARLTGGQPGGGGELAKLLEQLLTVEPAVRPQVPLDVQRIAPQFRRPIVIGDHRHAGRHLHHFVHAGYRQRLGAFKGFDAAAEHGRASDHRGHQAVELHVHAEFGATGDFLRGIQALGGFADDLPVLGFLELDRRRVRHRQLAGVIGQFAIGGVLVAGNHHPRLGANRRGRDVEALGRGLDQQQACRCTGLAITVELHPGRGRAAGDLHAAEPGKSIVGG